MKRSNHLPFIKVGGFFWFYLIYLHNQVKNRRLTRWCEPHHKQMRFFAIFNSQQIKHYNTSVLINDAHDDGRRMFLWSLKRFSFLDKIKKRNTSFSFGNEILRCYQVCMERVKRIELSSSAWKAEVLPLNYTRVVSTKLILTKKLHGCNRKIKFFVRICWLLSFYVFSLDYNSEIC